MKGLNITFALMLLFLSCNSVQENYLILNFIGDSHIRNWDLNYWFPLSDNRNFGVPGLTTAQLNNDTSIVDLQNQKILLIGINDIFRLYSNEREDSVIIDSVLTNYKDIIYSFNIRYNILCVSIIPVTKEINNLYNNRLNDIIFELNDQIEIICRRNNIMFYNAASLLAYKKDLKSVYSLDGIHLNNVGYEILSKEIRNLFY